MERDERHRVQKMGAGTPLWKSLPQASTRYAQEFRPAHTLSPPADDRSLLRIRVVDLRWQLLVLKALFRRPAVLALIRRIEEVLLVLARDASRQ